MGERPLKISSQLGNNFVRFYSLFTVFLVSEISSIPFMPIRTFDPGSVGLPASFVFTSYVEKKG